MNLDFFAKFLTMKNTFLNIIAGSVLLLKESHKQQHFLKILITRNRRSGTKYENTE